METFKVMFWFLMPSEKFDQYQILHLCQIYNPGWMCWPDLTTEWHCWRCIFKVLLLPPPSHTFLQCNGPLVMAWLDILIASNPFLGWLASGEIFTRSPSVLKFTKIAVKNYQKLAISYIEWSWHYTSAGPNENLTGFRIWLDAYWCTIAKYFFGRLRLSLAGWWCIVEIILILVSSFASAQETPSFFYHTLFSFN